MQTILGAGGGAGTELAKALGTFTKHIRIVNRSPKKVNPGDQLIQAYRNIKSLMEKARGFIQLSN